MRTTRRRATLAVGLTRRGLAGRLRQRQQVRRHTAAPATTAGAATTAAGRRRPPRRPRRRARPPLRARPRRAGSTPSSTPAEHLGLIDGVYKGTGGFEIDPKDCPSDWNPKQGITDTDIDLYISLPTSGPLAGFGADRRRDARLLQEDQRRRRHRRPQDQPDVAGRRVPAGQDQDERRRGARLEQVRRAVRRARHAEQPGDLGHDQRRVHAAAVQRHRCGAVGRRGEPPVDPRAAARLLHRGRACGPSGCRPSIPS